MVLCKLEREKKGAVSKWLGRQGRAGLVACISNMAKCGPRFWKSLDRLRRQTAHLIGRLPDEGGITDLVYSDLQIPSILANGSSHYVEQVTPQLPTQYHLPT